MEKKKKNVIFNKSGSGNLTTKIAVPMSWLTQMGVSQEDKEVEIIFDGETIIIKKEFQEGREMKNTIEFGKFLQEAMKKKNINNFNTAQKLKLKIEVNKGFDALNDLMVLCLDLQCYIPGDVSDILIENEEARKNAILEICIGMIAE